MFIPIGAGEETRDGGSEESEGSMKGSSGMTSSFSHCSSSLDESSVDPALALVDNDRRSGGVR
jgi:hypothetical protein